MTPLLQHVRLSSLCLHSTPPQDFLVWQAPKRVHQLSLSERVKLQNVRVNTSSMLEYSNDFFLTLHSRLSYFPGNCLCISSFVSGILLLLKTITSIFRPSRVTRLLTRATSCPRGVPQLCKIQHHAHPTCECYLFTQCYRQMNVVTWSEPA